MRAPELAFGATLEGRSLRGVIADPITGGEGSSAPVADVLRRTAAYMSMCWRGAPIGHANRPGESEREAESEADAAERAAERAAAERRRGGAVLRVEIPPRLGYARAPRSGGVHVGNVGKSSRVFAPVEARYVGRGIDAWSFAGIAGCAGGPRREPPGATAREEAPMAGATSPTSPTSATSPTGEPHPGQIVYEDRGEQRSWTRSAAEVPPPIARVNAGGRGRPVVRIEIDGAGDRREISKLGPDHDGPDHELLEVTTARMGPPAPRPE